MKDLIQLRRLTMSELITLCCGFSVAINACLIAFGLNMIGLVVGASDPPTVTRQAPQRMTYGAPVRGATRTGNSPLFRSGPAQDFVRRQQFEHSVRMLPATIPK